MRGHNPRTGGRAGAVATSCNDRSGTDGRHSNHFPGCTMLGHQRFQFETPNVIDNGDEPPVRPQRRQCDEQRLSLATESSSNSGSDLDESYLQERESRKRLINSVSAIELNPEPYDPYDEENQEHSLPTPAEARANAMLLATSPWKDEESDDTEEKKPIMSRTIQIMSPRKHATRNTILPTLIKIAAAATLLLLGGMLGGILTRRNRNAAHMNTDESHYRNQMIQFLHEYEITSRQDMTQPGTPQYQALLWLSTQDALQPPVPQNIDDNRFVQRYILAVLYYSLGGPNWKHQLNFLSSQDECAWSHASTNTDFVDETFAIGASCDQTLKVRNIVLPRNNLQGSIPSELRFLLHLGLISLSDNNVTGTIPHLASLSELRYLDLKFNQITGTLPRFIGELPDLQVLGLSNNNMTGVIPSTLAGLTRMHTLALDDNEFTGSLRFANSLTTLEFFYADRNQFSDTVDDSFLSKLLALIELDLSSNMLASSQFPGHLLQLPRLSVLDLSDNSLQGPLPDGLMENTALRFLSFRYNLLNGTADPLSNLVRLTHLDIYDNRFTGSLPDTFENLKSMTYLFAGFNNFVPQPIPSFLIEMTELRELGLQASNLKGIISGWLGHLEHLRLVDLSENSLHGSVPQQLYDIPSLLYLLLNENDLTGTIPPSIQGSDKLKLLTLHKTNVKGDLNPLCDAATNRELFAVDCDNVACKSDCCPKCCAVDEDGCFLDEMNAYLTVYEGLWEFGFARASFAYDPFILDEFPVALQPESRPNDPVP